MRISDWSSDVCSSDLNYLAREASIESFLPWIDVFAGLGHASRVAPPNARRRAAIVLRRRARFAMTVSHANGSPRAVMKPAAGLPSAVSMTMRWPRSEEHTSELQSLMRISYAVFCLKKKNTEYTNNSRHTNTNTQQDR